MDRRSEEAGMAEVAGPREIAHRRSQHCSGGDSDSTDGDRMVDGAVDFDSDRGHGRSENNGSETTTCRSNAI